MGYGLGTGPGSTKCRETLQNPSPRSLPAGLGTSCDPAGTGWTTSIPVPTSRHPAGHSRAPPAPTAGGRGTAPAPGHARASELQNQAHGGSLGCVPTLPQRARVHPNIPVQAAVETAENKPLFPLPQQRVSCWWARRRKAGNSRPIPAFPTLEGIRAPHFSLQQPPGALGRPKVPPSSAGAAEEFTRNVYGTQRSLVGQTRREEQPPGPASTDGFIHQSSSSELPQLLGVSQTCLPMEDPKGWGV